MTRTAAARPSAQWATRVTIQATRPGYSLVVTYEKQHGNQDVMQMDGGGFMCSTLEEVNALVAELLGPA